jgi:phospholipid/cholesterol/gamma-HCH transport system permease protein
MSSPLSVGALAVTPFAAVGRATIGIVHYFGGLATVVFVAAGTALRVGATRDFRTAVTDDLGWMFLTGLPLVGIAHVGLGSFLAMQAYYGGTFLDGTGAVVGVGLFRNIAPQMACYVLTGLLAARATPEVLGMRREGAAGLGRLISARLVAACIAGPVLSFWGAVAGTAVGWRVGVKLIGVSSHSFFYMFWEMMWARDVTGLVVKGAAFGFVAAAFACFEGLRGAGDDRPDAAPRAAYRAACFAMLAILFVNSGWFVLAYHAGPAFGPTLLTPPST